MQKTYPFFNAKIFVYTNFLSDSLCNEGFAVTQLDITIIEKRNNNVNYQILTREKTNNIYLLSPTPSGSAGLLYPYAWPGEGSS